MSSKCTSYILAEVFLPIFRKVNVLFQWCTSDCLLLRNQNSLEKGKEGAELTGHLLLCCAGLSDAGR